MNRYLIEELRIFLGLLPYTQGFCATLAGADFGAAADANVKNLTAQRAAQGLALNGKGNPLVARGSPFL